MTAPVRALQIAAVSAYLGLVALWLLLRRRVPARPLVRFLQARLRAPYAAALENVQPENGKAWTAPLPGALLSDFDGRSSLALFEDGEPLGPPHSAHSDIRRLGGGRFSHWGPRIYFSTSDDSDPRHNGRRYEVRENRL